MRQQVAIEGIVREALGSLGLELWGMDFVPGKQQVVLRIFIDKVPEGVGVDDCAQASRHIARCLEVEEVIRGRFTLEVSSPGFERTLYRPEQYEPYIGRSVQVKVTVPREGRRQFQGILSEVQADNFTLQLAQDSVTFSFSEVMKATLVAM